MDNPLKELEDELVALHPVRPSQRLERRIAAELAPRRRVHWLWMALPAAAAFAIMFAWQMQRQHLSPAEWVTNENSIVETTQPASAFKPVATQNLLYAARDDGLVTLEDGRVVHRTSHSYVDTVVWRDPQSNASVTWTVPREEVRLRPVSFQ